MNVRQLEAFRATMRSGSITEAAAMMNLSQPSVSRLVSDLEHAVGFPLFVRSGRGLSPTAEAKTFYNGVEGMFTGIDRLKELANGIRTSSAVEITIGTIQSIAAVELPKAVNAIYQEMPHTSFMIQSRNTPAILDAVQMDQIDLGVVGRAPPYDGVDVLYQTAAPYVCLIPETHDLADQSGPVDLRELVDEHEFVTFGGAFPETMMSMDPQLAYALQNGSRLSATNMPMTGSLVREIGVLAICDPFTAEQMVMMGGVVFRPLKQDLKYHVALITSGRHHLSRPALKFVDILSSQIEQRIVEVHGYRNPGDP